MESGGGPRDWIDVTKGPYNAKGDGTGDDSGAINSAILAAAGTGGVVYMPPGTYRLTSNIDPRSNVTLRGAGVGKTILKPVGAISAIQRGGSVGNMLTDCVFCDFEIDGSLQTGSPPSNKGIFMTYLRRPRFERLYVHDTGASGIGVDYLVDYVFLECVVERAGRLGSTSSAGCSGFGIGVGQLDVENGQVIGCVARDNKRYGIFFEGLGGTAPPYYPKGVEVIGGTFTGNFRGIGDNGLRGLSVVGAHVFGNLDIGVYVGADQAWNAGYDGLIESCHIFGNTSHGVLLDWTVGAQTGKYVVRGNRITDNGGCGVKAQGNGTLPGVVIADNPGISRNNASGIFFSGGTYPDVEMLRNRINANGQNHASAKMGIHVNGATFTRPRIVDNHCFDDGSPQKQTYGIDLASATAVTGGEIRGNDVRNNLTGAMNLPTLASTLVRGNPGYNPLGLDSLSPSASPWTYTAGPTPETIYLIGGTVSTVKVNTVTVATQSNVTIDLEPFDVLEVTYSAALTAVKRHRR